MNTKKLCAKCLETKISSNFYLDKSKKSGLSSWCRSCVLKKQKKYQQENRSKIQKYRKKYNQENAEKISENVKLYYNKNKERILLQNKEYVNKNRDLKRERDKNYYLKNKEKILQKTIEYSKNKRKTDALFLLKHRIRTRITNSIKGKGYTKKSKTFEILGCDYIFFKQYLESQFTKEMNWNNIHLDHIKPLATAKTEKEVLELNHYTNFQPLLAKENMLKKDKIIPKQLRII